MAGYAVQLPKDDANVLGALRHLRAHELLHGAAEDPLVVEVADVVHPVEEGDHLVVLLTLRQLLRPPVQVADMRLCIDHNLPVHPQQHPEDAVGAGVLRPHVHQQVYLLAFVQHGHGSASLSSQFSARNNLRILVHVLKAGVHQLLLQHPLLLPFLGPTAQLAHQLAFRLFQRFAMRKTGADRRWSHEIPRHG